MSSISLPDFLRRKPRPVVVPAIRLAGVIGSVGLGGRGLTLAGPGAVRWTPPSRTSTRRRWRS